MRSKTLISNFVIAVAIAALLVCPAFVSADTNNPGTFRAPSIRGGAVATNVYWTAGTINNGGDSVAVAAGSHALTANQNDCAAPTFTACNFLYANSAGAVDLTQTLATAVASGNTLLAMIETGAADAILTNIVLPQQSGTLWNQATGPAVNAVTALSPASAGGTTAGTAALPFSSAYIGNAATNNFRITGTATGARTVTMADGSGTIMVSSLATNMTDAANSVNGASNALVFEGATANDFELSLAPADVTADRTATFPDATGTVMLSALATNAPDAANSVTGASNALVFEGATANDHETSFTPTDPTADRTVTVPNASFTMGAQTVTWAQGGIYSNAVDTQFFVADRAYLVTAINVVWGTAETTGAMDIMVERLQGTEACGSGDDLQNAVVDATGAANTVATPALTGTPALLSLAAGNRLCVDLTATPNEVANMVITVTLQPE